MHHRLTVIRRDGSAFDDHEPHPISEAVYELMLALSRANHPTGRQLVDAKKGAAEATPFSLG